MRYLPTVVKASAFCRYYSNLYMKGILLLLTLTALMPIQLFGQINRLNMDSVFAEYVEKLDPDVQREIKAAYDTASADGKELLLFMISMPRSSKEELIANIETNFDNIQKLKDSYSTIVPDGYHIDIEFDPPNIVYRSTETINLKISKLSDSGNYDLIYMESGLEYYSAELDSILQVVGWSYKTLKEIKQLLDDAHCISIFSHSNTYYSGSFTEIGFSRSGLGKFFYLFFDYKLNEEEYEHYNNGCTSLHFEGDIFLEYSGGAVGPQCFTDLD